MERKALRAALDDRDYGECLKAEDRRGNCRFARKRRQILGSKRISLRMIRRIAAKELSFNCRN